MAMVVSPCLDCEQRTMTCHGNCEAYEDFKVALKKEHEWLKEEKSMDSFCYHRVKKENRRFKRYGYK